MSSLEFTDEFQKLESMLFGFAMRITRNRENARDLLQETALRAYKNRDRFKVGTNFRAWLATIMKNTYINIYRKNKKRSNLEHPLEKFMFALEGRKVKDNAHSNLMMEDLNQIMDSLSDAYKVPFTLFYEGYQYDEIAAQMNIPMGTVKSRIFYARKQLKEKINNRFTELHYGEKK